MVIHLEKGWDAPHLIPIGTAWIDDRADSRHHRTIEHLKLTGDRVETVVGDVALELLPGGRLDRFRMQTGRTDRIRKSSLAASKQAVRDA